MFEHHTQPLATPAEFAQRMLRYSLITAGIILFSLIVGMLGYHFLESLSWIDSLLNASMILGGMGPVDRMETNGAKVFAALYALFSGLVFVGIAGLVLAPWAHRLLHRLHIDDRDS